MREFSVLNTLKMMLRQNKILIEINNLTHKHFEPVYETAIYDKGIKEEERENIINDLYPYVVEWKRENKRLEEEILALEAAIRIISENPS